MSQRSGRAVYMIGPSSVGKSYLSARVAADLGLVRHDCDELRDPDLRDWSKVRPWLDALDALPVLVDIGAGTQESCGPQLMEYLRERADRVVLVIDDPEAAFPRNVEAGHRHPSQWRNYLEVEYDSRAALYTVARHRLERREMTAAEAQETLAAIVTRIVGD